MQETAKTKNSLIDALKNIKLSKPTSGAAANSPELTKALLEAKETTEKYGITSAEARLAWETYEEIASSGTENAYGINLAEECGIESGQDACQGMWKHCTVLYCIAGSRQSIAALALLPAYVLYTTTAKLTFAFICFAFLSCSHGGVGTSHAHSACHAAVEQVKDAVLLRYGRLVE